jgi:Transglutaminase-like superfamily
MTDPGEYRKLFEGLPASPGGVAEVVQGLMVHEFWADAYGLTLTDEQKQTVHLRKTSELLAAIVGVDDRPLTEARAPERRIATNCRGFSVLAVAMLRHAGVPARARCGFGAYFNAGKFEDHWIVEYQAGGRWRMLDAQLDELQRNALKIGFDVTDMPAGEFVVAGDAWRRCRAGESDPAAYGLSPLNEGGWWWIAGNLMRDLAALDDVELLPWDVWGEMPEPGAEVDFALFDAMAAGERPVGAVPDKVFNALRQRPETIR